MFSPVYECRSKSWVSLVTGLCQSTPKWMLNIQFYGPENLQQVNDSVFVQLPGSPQHCTVFIKMSNRSKASHGWAVLSEQGLRLKISTFP